MSYTTIYAVPELGGIVIAAEFGNAWGSGSYIWSELSKRRLGWDHWITRCPDGLQPLWDLAGDVSLPEFERITLGTTTDRVMVRRENLPRVAAAFRAFVEAYPPGESACSLLAQADVLDRLSDDPACFAVCWNQTSVSDAWPWVYGECESCGAEREDDGRPYDVSRDTDHWFLFDELPTANSKGPTDG